jgi:hypothetical protein
MSLLLYGITLEYPNLNCQTEMELVNAAGLSAIVKTNINEISREPAVVLAYGEQIWQIHQKTTLIPVRYGSQLADETKVRQLLTDNAVHYKKKLAELADCDEMGVRLPINSLENHPVNKSIISGHEYLLARKQAYTVPEEIKKQADTLNDALSGCYRQYCAELSLFNGRRTYLLSYLVPRDKLLTFQEKITGFIDIRFISGPWPLYSFAG